MSLPNMSSALLGWEQSVTLKSVSTATIDFEPVQSISNSTILAVVQPADMETLRPEDIDWSLRYVQIHSRVALSVGKYITYNTTDYKIVRLLQYGDYGYYSAVCEEVKGAFI